MLDWRGFLRAGMRVAQVAAGFAGSGAFRSGPAGQVVRAAWERPQPGQDLREQPMIGRQP
jgi:hypothetical protein